MNLGIVEAATGHMDMHASKAVLEDSSDGLEDCPSLEDIGDAYRELKVESHDIEGFMGKNKLCHSNSEKHNVPVDQRP